MSGFDLDSPIARGRRRRSIEGGVFPTSSEETERERRAPRAPGRADSPDSPDSPGSPESPESRPHEDDGAKPDARQSRREGDGARIRRIRARTKERETSQRTARGFAGLAPGRSRRSGTWRTSELPGGRRRADSLDSPDSSASRPLEEREKPAGERIRRIQLEGGRADNANVATGKASLTTNRLVIQSNRCARAHTPTSLTSTTRAIETASDTLDVEQDDREGHAPPRVTIEGHHRGTGGTQRSSTSPSSPGTGVRRRETAERRRRTA